MRIAFHLYRRRVSALAAMPGVFLHIPPDKSTPPRPVNVSHVADALEWAANELHEGKKRASKDRVDLAALAAHSGTSYAQVELVPESLFSTVREARASVARDASRERG